MANSNRGSIDHALAFLATLFLLAALLLPGNSVQSSQDDLLSRWLANLPTGIDKWVHALLFFFETWILHRSSRHFLDGSRAIFLATGGAAFLAAFTEVGQLWVPFRSFEPLDLVANSTGIAAAAIWVLWKYQIVTISRR